MWRWARRPVCVGDKSVRFSQSIVAQVTGDRDPPGRTPSIFAYCLPVAVLVNTASSSSVVASMRAPLSRETEPPVKMGCMTRSGSNVVLKGSLVVILTGSAAQMDDGWVKSELEESLAGRQAGRQASLRLRRSARVWREESGSQLFFFWRAAIRTKVILAAIILRGLACTSATLGSSYCSVFVPATSQKHF